MTNIGRHLVGSIFGPAYSSRLLFIAYHRRIGCIPRFQKKPDHQRAMASILEKHGLKFVNPADGQEVADQLHFSHAVILPPNARTVIISGQVGILPDGSVPQSLEDEYDEAFTHVENVLRAIGFGEDALEYVFDATFFLKGGMDPSLLVEVARRRFKNTRPATVGVEIAQLLHPDLHLEIKVVAYMPDSVAA
ncbi:hypothetical protein ABEF93_003322 [Exophiala dermatitidis]